MNIPFNTRATKDRIIAAALDLGCSPAEALVLAKHARLTRREPGQMLAELGGVADQIHVVIEGRAIATPSDGETSVIEVGGVVGELFAYRVAMFQLADVVCDEPTTAMTLTHAKYRELREQLPYFTSLVEAARNERAAVVEGKRQAERVARWNRYQELKQYI